MKLYFSPGACSLSPNIVAHELGLDVELVKVDIPTKKTAAGGDFLAVNPKGYVPALVLDDGEVLTEGPAIVQYLADRKPGRIAPENGTLGRYRVQEALGYINSEIHKTYSPLFNPKTTQDERDAKTAYLKKRYAWVEQQLGKNAFLTGSEFSVADAYLFTVTNWAKHLKIDLSEFPNLLAFQKKVGERPAVQAAIAAEKAA